MTKCFAGLDWASRTHAVCVIDARARVLAQFEVSHDAGGRAELCRRLRAVHVTAVAIERPSGLLVEFAEVGSPIALAFIQRYPTPEAASRLGPKRMAAFCAQHAYCGRRSAQELLQRLNQAPAVTLGELEMEAKGELALNLARVLARLIEQINLLTSRIEHAVQSCEDGRILMSFPRAGRICAAQILSEMGSVRERFEDAERLAAEAGVTPVTYESGKSKAVAFRWACNHRLRTALTCLADNSRHASAVQRHTGAMLQLAAAGG